VHPVLTNEVLQMKYIGGITIRPISDTEKISSEEQNYGMEEMSLPKYRLS
jgi:hypothetical protein